MRPSLAPPDPPPAAAAPTGAAVVVGASRAARGDTQDAAPDGVADAAPPVPCPSCATTIVERFCPRCCEKRTERDDLSLAHLARELWEHVANLDGRLFRTLVLLLRRPGFLSVEFSRGVRGAYTRPLQLYLLTSVAFFVLARPLGLFDYRIPQPIDPRVLEQATGWRMRLIARKAAELGSLETLRTRFNETVGTHMGLVFLLVVPALALLLAALHPRTRRFAAEHLVFAVHATTAALLIELAIGGTGWALGRLPALAGASTFYAAAVVSLIAVWGYAALAMRRAYGDSPAGAALRAVAVAGAFALFPRVFWLAVTTLTWLLL